MARPAKMTREQIYEEAAKLFALRGYAGASIQDLADALGVNKSAIYYYCRSKEDLLFEISRDAMERTLERVRSAVVEEGSPETVIRRAVHAHVSSLAETLYEHRTMMTELESLSPKHRMQVKLLRDRYEAIWIELVDRGAQEGTFSNPDTKFILLGTLGALNWMIFWYDPDQGSVDDIADRLANFVLHGFGMAGVPSLASHTRRPDRAANAAPRRRPRAESV